MASRALPPASLLGITPSLCFQSVGAGIALPLIKRMREIAFGIPALISWQWAEAWRMRRQWRDQGSAKSTHPSD